jgi:hypothetical protein
MMVSSSPFRHIIIHLISTSYNGDITDTLWVGVIPEHFEPGPTGPAGPARARPAHEPYWMGVGRDLEAREIFFGPSPARNADFS